MRILILEDHFSVRQQLVSLVEGMGHTAVAVTTNAEALDVLKHTEMDAVITDVFIQHDGNFMPAGGIQLIGAIRFSNLHRLRIPRKAPILVISGGSEIPGGYSPLRTARDVGADFCLRKPLDMDEVAVWIMDVEVAMSLAAEESAERH